MVVSALALNFVADRRGALADMQRAARPGATVAFYAWDYPGGGLEFARAFWDAAVGLDPGAKGLTGRFPFCTRDGLAGLAEVSGLIRVESAPLEATTVFGSFEEYWQPFARGAGPAPRYCAGLDPTSRRRLKEALRDSLPRGEDGSIRMRARAWAVKGTVRRRASARRAAVPHR